MSADPTMFTPEFWDARYGATDRLWSGEPNPVLVTYATGLAAGTALDVGCGEGADTIWLAARGWRVTGIDVSQVALDRAAEHAGVALSGQIDWQQGDLRTWEPGIGGYDLVTAQFAYLPPPDLPALHQRLAAAVAPGGTLLVVGHHPSDAEVGMRPAATVHVLFTADQIAPSLDPADWELVEVTSPARPAMHPEGRPVTVHDTVLHALRRT